jgi:hypothetical protein
VPADAAPAQQRFWDALGRAPGEGAGTGLSALQIDRSRRYLRRILVGSSEAGKLQSRWDRVNVHDVPNGADQPSPNLLTLLPPDDDSGRTSPTVADSCQLAVRRRRLRWLTMQRVFPARPQGSTDRSSCQTPQHTAHLIPKGPRDPPRLVSLVAGVETIRRALTKDYAGGEAWEPQPMLGFRKRQI